MDYKTSKLILLYTMTDGLGDFLVMSDVMRKAEKLLPNTSCYIVHRHNPHIHSDKAFDIHKFTDILSLIGRLRNKRKDGFAVFGFQMAPGSLQGFILHKILKKLGVLDHVVDFNLINADIVTPPRGGYILDLHLNQIHDVFGVDIPDDFYNLRLPFSLDQSKDLIHKPGRRLVGIHPWSRRGTEAFFWPLLNWAELIKALLPIEGVDFVIFGRDKQFTHFQSTIVDHLGEHASRVHFLPSTSVVHLAQTVNNLDFILTVNTSVVHMGYALDKKMVVLSGPTLSLWNPKGPNIRIVTDSSAVLKGADRTSQGSQMPRVARITVQQVIDAFKSI